MTPVFTTFDELRQQLDAFFGVLTVEMRTLRDLHNADRLGIHVRNGISSELSKRGIAHYPKSLPDYQEALVRLYRQGSPVGKIIDASLHVGGDGDALLTRVASSNAEEILAKIRELVEA
jgi:hypothetical protein